MKHIKSVLEGVVSQGRLVGSRGYSFRASSSSNATGKHNHGIDIGASRNYAHEKAAKEKSAERTREREQAIEKRNKEAEKRQKEVSKMANEEEIQEAKRFVYDKPQSHLVKMYDKKPTEDLHAMHKRWSGDHTDKKSNPSRSEDLLAVHHVLKSRGQNPSELPQHKNLGMMRMHEETNTEKRMKIKNVARPGDPEPTSEKSTLSKTGSIKTKIVEEKPTMSLPNFGLPASLIAAARQIVEKKNDDNGDAKKMEGGKTAVIIDPETDDKINEGEPKKKHTTPKTAGEKKLAALAHPKDKITHKDVLVGRGVLRKEETEIDEAQEFGRKPFKATSVAQHTDSSGNKHSLWTRSDTGDRVYYNKTYPDGKVGNSHKGMEPTYDSKEKAMNAFRKHVKEETKIEEAIKPYVSYSGPRPGKSPSATVMAAGEKPHKTFTKDEHGHDYKQKAMDYFKKNMKKLQSEEVEIEEAIKPYVSYSGPGIGKSPSATVMAAGEKPHKTFTKAEHGHDYKEKAMDYFKKNMKKLQSEEVELTAEELERIESIAAQLDEAKPTIVSAPIRGANQDQSGFGVKKSTADYTISDEKKVRKEEVELEEGRGRPKKSGGEAEGDDTHKHPIQQLTKIAHAIEGSEPHFEHKDGTKSKIGKHLAKHVMAVYGSMRTSQDKDDFANKLHASKDSMKSAVSKLF